MQPSVTPCHDRNKVFLNQYLIKMALSSHECARTNANFMSVMTNSRPFTSSVAHNLFHNYNFTYHRLPYNPVEIDAWFQPRVIHVTKSCQVEKKIYHITQCEHYDFGFGDDLFFHCVPNFIPRNVQIDFGGSNGLFLE